MGYASQRIVSRSSSWIWFLGAAVWFFDAALGMYYGSLERGIADAGISALFLVVGMYFRRQSRRQPPPDMHH